VRTALALLAAAVGAGFQTGNYASSSVAPLSSGETGTIKEHLHGTTATGTVTLQAHFFIPSLPNPHGPSHCGVKHLAWTASTQFG
jgi:hypothetical protein